MKNIFYVTKKCGKKIVAQRDSIVLEKKMFDSLHFAFMSRWCRVRVGANPIERTPCPGRMGALEKTIRGFADRDG